MERRMSLIWQRLPCPRSAESWQREHVPWSGLVSPTMTSLVVLTMSKNTFKYVKAICLHSIPAFGSNAKPVLALTSLADVFRTPLYWPIFAFSTEKRLKMTAFLLAQLLFDNIDDFGDVQGYVRLRLCKCNNGKWQLSKNDVKLKLMTSLTQ